MFGAFKFGLVGVEANGGGLTKSRGEETRPESWRLEVWEMESEEVCDIPSREGCAVSDSCCGARGPKLVLSTSSAGKDVKRVLEKLGIPQEKHVQGVGIVKRVRHADALCVIPCFTLIASNAMLV